MPSELTKILVQQMRIVRNRRQFVTVKIRKNRLSGEHWFTRSYPLKQDVSAAEQGYFFAIAFLRMVACYELLVVTNSHLLRIDSY